MKHRSGVLSKIRARVRRGEGGQPTLDYINISMRDPCPYCWEFGCDSVDHIVPVARREEICTGFGLNHWSNLTACHKECNEAKSDRGVFI